MKIALVMPGRSTEALHEALREEMGGDAHIDPHDTSSEADFIVAWQHSPGSLARFTDARAIYSYGAGVDFLLADPTLPDVPIGRVVIPELGHQMARYCLAQVLSRSIHLADYARDQQARRWQPRDSADPFVVILGAGQIGAAVADAFGHLGCPVRLYRRTASGDENEITTMDALHVALERASYVINCLPLTEQTRGVIDYAFMSRMQRSAYLINVGRGAHVVEADLLRALDDDLLAGAVLDVVATEPLPTDSALWSHPRISMTPHIASLTDPRSAARVLAAEFQRIMAGDTPKFLVNKELQY